MLYEIRHVRQIPGEDMRRWFFDNDIDLLIWEKVGGEIAGFQLCYGKPHNTHALTWFKDSGYAHNKVDEGEDKPGRQKGAPLLVADGVFDLDRVARQFKEKSDDIDKEISGFIYDKILAYH